MKQAWPMKKRRKRISIWVKLVLLFLALLALLIVVEDKLSPIIETQAMNKVNNLALITISDTIAKELIVYQDAEKYQNLMDIERDEQGKIVLMAADTMLINSLVNALTADISKSLSDLAEQDLRIPLMAATGSKLFSSYGPDLPIRILGIATPQVTLSDKFVSAGINQIKHSIYLEVKTELQIAVPFDQSTMTISTKMLLAEGIIVGDIPETFVQFDSSNGK